MSGQSNPHGAQQEALAAGKDGVTLKVKALPRAPVSRVVGLVEGALKVRVAAAPVDGEANEELIKTLASFFGVPRSAVKITSGKSSRHKLAAVRGLSYEKASQLLAALG